MAKNIFCLTLNEIEPNLADHIVFTMQGLTNSQSIILAEVKMDSVELASKNRKAVCCKAKGWPRFINIEHGVKVDIMRLMAKKSA